MKYDQITVLIPAYKPDEKLVKLVDDLIAADLRRIVVVDDGGGEAYKPIFDAIREKAHVLTHPVNRGKGAALKTGLKHIMKKPGGGVVTADADGQHTPADIARIADVLLEKPDTLVIGSRDKKAMPPRSKAGNTLTCAVFGLLTGLWLNDTQTGLRGLPKSALEAFSDLEGDRYEYEINMLLTAAQSGMPVIEEWIETVYLDDNASSHFNPLKDSLKIYLCIFKFAASSLLAFVIDYVLVLLFSALTKSWPPSASLNFSVIAARLISATVNFTVNRKVVFNGNECLWKAVLKYAALALIVLGLNLLLMHLLTGLGWSIPLAKIVVEIILFCMNFVVQGRFVYRKGNTGKAS